MTFLDVNIIREIDKIYTQIDRIYTQFDSFLPSTYKIGMILHCYIAVSGFAQIGLGFVMEL